MSDIRFNSWLHQSGTGGIHQDSAGNIGIGSTQPVSALDLGTGNVHSHNIHSTGIVTATSFVGNVTGNLTGTASNATGITTTQITVGDTFIKSTSIGIGSTSTSGRNAGINTTLGTIIYNATNNRIESYGPEGWVNVKSLIATGHVATGGIINDYQDGSAYYRTHTFTCLLYTSDAADE